MNTCVFAVVWKFILNKMGQFLFICRKSNAVKNNCVESTNSMLITLANSVNGSSLKLGSSSAWRDLKTKSEKVDTNKSGQVDINEFKTAIKSERMMELNMGSLFSKLGIEVASKEDRFRAFEATMRRRRLMKQNYEENVQKATKNIIEKLCQVTGKAVPHKDEDKQKMYNTLKDTFNAFDGDGSGQLGYPEYVEAWKFLNRPGGEEAIKVKVKLLVIVLVII